MRNRNKEIYRSIPEGCNRQSQYYKSKAVETPESCGRHLPGGVVAEPPRQRRSEMEYGKHSGWSHIKSILRSLCLGSESLSRKRREPAQKHLRVAPSVGRAFTLIELLVVVLIIGILAAIAIPQYQQAVEKARATEAINMIRAIFDANQRYFMANGSYALHITDLDIEVPGNDVMVHTQKRKQTPYFEYGTFGWSNETTMATDVLAVANRLPRGETYGFNVFSSGRIACIVYNQSEIGTKICRAISGKSTPDKPTSYYLN